MVFINPQQQSWKVITPSLIFMVHGLGIVVQGYTTLTSSIAHLLVYPSLTVYRRTRTIRICMPWCCLHLVQLLQFNLRQSFFLVIPTDGLQQMLSIPLHCLNKVISVLTQWHKNTASLTGNTAYAGNFGLWQGSLTSDAHKVTLDYHSPVATSNTVSPNLDWKQSFSHAVWHNRALTLISCWAVQ